MFCDVKSLYPTILDALLPVGEFYELKPTKINNFAPVNKPT